MGGVPSLGVPGGIVTALLLAAGLVVLVVREVRAQRGESRRHRRATLLTLRVATALGVWLVAVQPRLVSERTEHRAGRLAVLFDASRSLRARDARGTRAEAARALAARLAAGPGAESADVYTFGANARPASLAGLGARLDPREDDTRLADVVRQVLAAGDRTGRDGGEVGAVVLVSDGADRARAPVAEALARLGVKVHTVALGGRRALRDDAIAAVAADATAFLRQTGRVRVTVRSTAGGAIPVVLRRGGVVLREAVVEVPAGAEASVELPLSADALGRTAYTVTIPVAADDDVPENNERAFVVRVVRDKLRVLLVCGRPSADQRFFREFLQRDPSIDLVSFFILRGVSDQADAQNDELALIPFPTDELFTEHLGSFDIVFFQNFAYGPYRLAGYLPNVADHIDRGGSFAMIGGELSFGGGAYADTPLAGVLPVEVPPAGASESELVDLETFRPTIAPALARQPVVLWQPEPAQSAAALRALAPLHGVNRVLGLRGEAEVLLEHPTLREPSGRPHPVLVVGTKEKGRTLALLTDDAWRWGLTTGGATGDASAYTRFWDRALRWLARDPTLEPAQLDTDRASYGPRGRVVVEGVLRDARYSPLADRAVALVMRRGAEGISRVAMRTDAEGRVRAELAGPEEPGAYTVAAVPEGAAGPLAEAVFVVETGGDELADPQAHPETLAAISAATGGAHYDSPDDAPPLARFDATRTRSLGVVAHAPFARWPFVLLVALLFGAEWFVRRRWARP
jgi:uncharacterized membrane protein